MTDKEILNADGSRNWEANILLDNLKRLEQENTELKAELQNFKDMAIKGLDEFKDVGGCWGCGLQLQLNQDMEDIKQLKADNERLKEELSGKRFICKDCMAFAKRIEQYKQTLQEIRTIAEDRTKTEDYLLGQEYTDLVDKIIDIITKAESEG